VKVFYFLIGSLLIVLLVHPEVLDRFQCTDDVTPTKPPFDFSNATSHEKHHLKVLSLKNLGKGLSDDSVAGLH